jgi:hypothetical protein
MGRKSAGIKNKTSRQVLRGEFDQPVQTQVTGDISAINSEKYGLLCKYNSQDASWG